MDTVEDELSVSKKMERERGRGRGMRAGEQKERKIPMS